MCHTGGPRCYEDAKASLVNAKKEFAENPTPETKQALKDAERDIVLTPEYIENLKKTKPGEAASLQTLYDDKLEGAKEYERFRSESSRTLTRLHNEQEKTLLRISEIDAEVESSSRNLKALQDEHVQGGFINDDEIEFREWQHDQKVEKLVSEKSGLVTQSELTKARIETVQKANADNLARRKQGLPLEHPHLMPEKFAGYFADTERKHFSAGSEGSTFTQARNLNQVLTETARQRKSLEGDDREKLIARGADPSSFAADKRYLMVETRGRLGTALASELSDDTPLQVVQKSEKSKPVCVAEVKRQQDTDFATVVLVDNPSLPGTEHHASLLITAFPGASGPTGSNNDLVPHVGKTITVGEARKIYGRDFTVNTVVKP